MSARSARAPGCLDRVNREENRFHFFGFCLLSRRGCRKSKFDKAFSVNPAARSPGRLAQGQGGHQIFSRRLGMRCFRHHYSRRGARRLSAICCRQVLHRSRNCKFCGSATRINLLCNGLRLQPLIDRESNPSSLL